MLRPEPRACRLRHAQILAVLAALASPMAVRAQSSPPADKPDAGAPDACQLLQKSDLEALFPGRSVTPKGSTLSPVFKGPQYNEGCMYVVRLPSPTSSSELAKFVSLTVVTWGKGASGRDGSIDTFANMRATQDKIASGNPSLKKTITTAPGIGDEAFQDVSEFTSVVRARKGDLIFVLSLDNYSTQTLPNALVLARQVATRWQEGTGMVAAQAPVAANTQVEVPPDTRKSAQAPADQWPDACALLKEEDVRSVFSDMKLDPVRKSMGTLTFEGREKRVEALPHPISCSYDAKKVLTEGGERKIVVNTVSLSVQDVAATPELAEKSYKVARKVGDAKTEIPGIGDEASLSPFNRIYIRKGLLNVAVSVNGDMRDRALYEDARERVTALAERVAGRLP